MFNQLITLSSKPSADFLLKLLISVAMVCIISPFIWNISPEYDVMFGSLMVCLAPAFFGWRIGAMAVFLYLVAGALGLQVFAGHHGGLHYFIPENGPNPSTGYLFGYLMAAFVVGALAEKIKPSQSIKVALLFIIGHVIIISLGFFHLYRIPDYTLEFINELKTIIPSFLVKLGMFVVIVSLIGRKLDSSFDSGGLG